MSDYPDPEEEFELMYGDELDLLREQDEDYVPISKQSSQSKRSLDFGVSNNVQVNDFDVLSNTEVQSTPDIFSANGIGSLNIPNEFSSACLNTKLSQNETVALNNKKRSAEELFGDITDLDEEIFLDIDVPIIKKSKKDENDEKLALIEHILELRRISKEKSNVVGILSTNKLTNSWERDKRNLSYSVPKYPFVGVTRFNDERVYVRFHSEEYEKEEIQRIVKESTFTGVMGERFKEVWKEAKELIQSQNTAEQQDVPMLTDFSENQEDEITKLWVDLYKPRAYLELLSDEGTNRILLRWIKLWDKIVFNRKPKVKPIKLVTEKENKKKYFKPQFELDTELDEHDRPNYKIALLCGPPGLGKTTLAHMVAKHAGYNVVEINASDDRSTDAFKTALENATQMRSLVDQEGRPNCLVFDEIDGAPQSSIEYLIKFVTGTVSKKNKKGKTQNASILKRPIICICNDVYVPALRPLRQVAFVVNFPPTSSTRLAERLMEIARKQQIKTDLGAMMALAEKSNNDIRSCLSILHFFKVQNKPVRLSDIYRTSLGVKDMQKGLFAVWNDIFQIERQNVQPGQEKADPKHNLQNRMNKILQVVSAFGDYDRVAQGVFENYTLLKLRDPTLESITTCLEWFIFSDMLNQQIYRLQNYSLSSYLQFAFVIWHFIFATHVKQKINYPSVGYEMKQKENRQIAIVSEVLRGLQPTIRSCCNRLTLILDILPLLVVIIVPNFRPVNLHLYTNDEKQNMLRIVNIMLDYNLNYVQERQQDGTFVFKLEPNIEAVVNLDKENSYKKRTMSYSNRQLISRELEMEKMRRFQLLSALPDSGAPKAREKNATKINCLKVKASPVISNNANLPNHLQTLKAKVVKVNTPAVKKDFFGRIISPPQKSEKTGGPNIKNDIWYQYKEGYSNAVRKRITISNLR